MIHGYNNFCMHYCEFSISYAIPKSHQMNNDFYFGEGIVIHQGNYDYFLFLETAWVTLTLRKAIYKSQ